MSDQRPFRFLAPHEQVGYGRLRVPRKTHYLPSIPPHPQMPRLTPSDWSIAHRWFPGVPRRCPHAAGGRPCAGRLFVEMPDGAADGRVVCPNCGRSYGDLPAGAGW